MPGYTPPRLFPAVEYAVSRLNEWPVTGNLSARAANGAHPQGMIGSYIEPFAEANICHKAEVAIRRPECIALRF
ncbi:hypothetical protein MKK64_10235 [Methylobacterium sp. E-025]|uniref:hypothetical protein n=1 Tax=Methylobacterium sp. E-025 TaxID=2836561 RepID=UPI001FBAA924|nr:hypothetical protein [Methylobacterium sp. E-025]MCJ2111570.1 hypothetical protein [Methylobacterium sp. E-025]